MILSFLWDGGRCFKTMCETVTWSHVTKSTHKQKRPQKVCARALAYKFHKPLWHKSTVPLVITSWTLHNLPRSSTRTQGHSLLTNDWTHLGLSFFCGDLVAQKHWSKHTTLIKGWQRHTQTSGRTWDETCHWFQAAKKTKSTISSHTTSLSVRTSRNTVTRHRLDFSLWFILQTCKSLYEVASWDHLLFV